MRFSKAELRLLERISRGACDVTSIAKSLKKDLSQVYRLLQNLDKNGFAKLQDGQV